MCVFICAYMYAPLVSEEFSRILCALLALFLVHTIVNSSNDLPEGYIKSKILLLYLQPQTYH